MNTGDLSSSIQPESPLPTVNKGERSVIAARIRSEPHRAVTRLAPGRVPLSRRVRVSDHSRFSQPKLGNIILDPRPCRTVDLMMFHLPVSAVIDRSTPVCMFYARDRKYIEQHEQHILVANLVTASLAIQSIWLTQERQRASYGSSSIVVVSFVAFRGGGIAIPRHCGKISLQTSDRRKEWQVIFGWRFRCEAIRCRPLVFLLRRRVHV